MTLAPDERLVLKRDTDGVVWLGLQFGARGSWHEVTCRPCIPQTRIDAVIAALRALCEEE